MLYKQKIITREPGLIHGLSSVKSVFNDAVENSNYPFYEAIRQEVRSNVLPILAQHLDAVASNLRENPNLCFDKEKKANF